MIAGRMSLVYLSALVAIVGGCASSAPYQWAKDMPQSQAADEYLIATGDLLAVSVYSQAEMSTRARVRNDGKIALPFLGDVEVAGKAPRVVSKELAVRLKAYLVSPSVTVTVEESLPASVSVLGEVARPGVYTVEVSAGVLQALALAGGFTEYADHGSIYVLRRIPAQRVRFTFSSLTAGTGRASTFRLRTGDVLVVE
jgi:polysaccharide export outer membrane protein